MYINAKELRVYLESENKHHNYYIINVGEKMWGKGDLQEFWGWWTLPRLVTKELSGQMGLEIDVTLQKERRERTFFSLQKFLEPYRLLLCFHCILTVPNFSPDLSSKF